MNARRGVLVLSLVSLVAAFAAAAGARAAYYDANLNVIAGAVAGHPVIVTCYDSPGEYEGVEYAHGVTYEDDGFTSPTLDNVIYLAPRICDTLHALLYGPGPDDVGVFWAGLAIKTLIHESVHQSGILDEGVTDCTALALVTTYAVKYFHYPAKVAKVSYVRQGKLYKRVTKTVPNPALARLYLMAEAWHAALPPEYQGGC